MCGEIITCRLDHGIIIAFLCATKTLQQWPDPPFPALVMQYIQCWGRSGLVHETKQFHGYKSNILHYRTVTFKLVAPCGDSCSCAIANEHNIHVTSLSLAIKSIKRAVSSVLDYILARVLLILDSS